MRDRGERKTVQKGGMKEKERAREKGGDSERDSDNTRAFKPPGLKQKAETKSLCASSGPSSLTHILKGTSHPLQPPPQSLPIVQSHGKNLTPEKICLNPILLSYYKMPAIDLPPVARQWQSSRLKSKPSPQSNHVYKINGNTRLKA